MVPGRPRYLITEKYFAFNLLSKVEGYYRCRSYWQEEGREREEMPVIYPEHVWFHTCISLECYMIKGNHFKDPLSGCWAHSHITDESGKLKRYL